MKNKKLFLTIACLCLGAFLVVGCAPGISASASTATPEFYKYYSPIHEISLVDKNEKLSVLSETMNFQFSDIETKNLPDFITSAYSINNSGSGTHARIAVPFQGVPRSRDWSDIRLTINGAPVTPKIYFEKHHDIYHPQWATDKPFINPANVLENAFGDLYSFEPAQTGTFYEFSPIDLEENMSIDFHLTENQKLYENGYFSARITQDGYLRVDKKDYASQYNSGRYTAFVTSGELDFESTNVSYISYSLSFNDLVSIMKEDVQRYGNYKFAKDFHDEYFEIFASNYLNYITTENDFTKYPVFSVGGMLDWWINEYRYMYAVYEIDFAPAETMLGLERPIDYHYFVDDICGFEINNAPIQSWASFGKTIINVPTSTKYQNAASWAFNLEKSGGSSYSYSGKLTNRTSYGVYYRADNFQGTWLESYLSHFDNNYGAYLAAQIRNNPWMIPLLIISGLALLYLLISTPLYIRAAIKERKRRKKAIAAELIVS